MQTRREFRWKLLSPAFISLLWSQPTTGDLAFASALLPTNLKQVVRLAPQKYTCGLNFCATSKTCWSWFNYSTQFLAAVQINRHVNADRYIQSHEKLTLFSPHVTSPLPPAGYSTDHRLQNTHHINKDFFLTFRFLDLTASKATLWFRLKMSQRAFIKGIIYFCIMKIVMAPVLNPVAPHYWQHGWFSTTSHNSLFSQ